MNLNRMIKLNIIVFCLVFLSGFILGPMQLMAEDGPEITSSTATAKTDATATNGSSSTVKTTTSNLSEVPNSTVSTPTEKTA